MKVYDSPEAAQYYSQAIPVIEIDGHKGKLDQRDNDGGFYYSGYELKAHRFARFTVNSSWFTAPHPPLLVKTDRK